MEEVSLGVALRLSASIYLVVLRLPSLLIIARTAFLMPALSRQNHLLINGAFLIDDEY